MNSKTNDQDTSDSFNPLITKSGSKLAVKPTSIGKSSPKATVADATSSRKGAATNEKYNASLFKYKNYTMVRRVDDTVNFDRNCMG